MMSPNGKAHITHDLLMELGFSQFGSTYTINRWVVWKGQHPKTNKVCWFMANHKEKKVLSYNYQLLNALK
jgi:hypothetical protein